MRDGAKYKLWRCRNGHVMGMAVRERVEGRHVHRLLLYRQAVAYEGEPPAEVDVIALVEGTALEIRCSVCGEVRAWYEG